MTQDEHEEWLVEQWEADAQALIDEWDAHHDGEELDLDQPVEWRFEDWTDVIALAGFLLFMCGLFFVWIGRLAGWW